MSSYETAARDAILSAFKELNHNSDHDDCVAKVYNKLRQAGRNVTKEKALKKAGNSIGYPDLTIMDISGNNACHIEIKCKNHFDQQDLEQCQKFRDAENGRIPVLLANMQPGKPEPNIRNN